MGIIENLGGSNVIGDTGSKLASSGKVLLIILGAFAILVVAGVITFNYYYKKKQKSQFKERIHIFKEVNGEDVPIDDDSAMEIYVPDSNVSLYYLKKRKLYIARPTRAMGKNAYWYTIRPNGEWVNFVLKRGSKKTFAEADYDHRDTRYAYINLKEIIKRNYKDKAVKWWKEYSHIITFIIVAFIFVLSSWIMLAKIGKVIGQLGPVAEGMKQVSENMLKVAGSCETSGVVGA